MKKLFLPLIVFSFCPSLFAQKAENGWNVGFGFSSPRFHCSENTIVGGDLDLIYYLTPCKPFTLYFFFGLGAAAFDPDWGGIVNIEAESSTAAEENFGLGTEWKIADNKTPEGRAMNRRIEFKIIN